MVLFWHPGGSDGFVLASFITPERLEMYRGYPVKSSKKMYTDKSNTCSQPDHLSIKYHIGISPKLLREPWFTITPAFSMLDRK